MAVTKKKVYLKGLGDLFLKANRVDKPSVVIDSAESITPWSALGSASVALSQVQLLEGSYSVAVSNVTGNTDGAKYTPAGGSADFSDNEDKLALFNIYPTNSGTVEVKIKSSTNYESFRYAVTANKWNRALVNLNAPFGNSGTVNWSAVSAIEVTSVSGETGNFYLDSMYFFDAMSDVERVENVRIGCLDQLGLEESDDTTELRCSRNEIEETEITSTTVTLSATVKDFDPNGLALLKAGEVTTDSVTAQVESEAFTVPASGPYTYTLAKATQLKVGNGYGVWVYNTSSGEMLQQTPESTIIPKGYYSLNTSTGVVTFSSQDAGISMTVTYNYVVGSGRTLEVKTDRQFREFALQFVIKGSNGKEALFFFPRIKSSSSSISPDKADFWSWDFSGSVLADEISKNYYEMHIKE